MGGDLLERRLWIAVRVADKPGGVIAAHGLRYHLFVDGAIQLLF